MGTRTATTIGIVPSNSKVPPVLRSLGKKTQQLHHGMCATTAALSQGGRWFIAPRGAVVFVVAQIRRAVASRDADPKAPCFLQNFNSITRHTLESSCTQS